MLNTRIDINESIIKALTYSHLNVPERQGLPEGKIPASIATSLIKENIERTGWFPHKATDDTVSGVFLEHAPDGYILHTFIDNEIARTNDESDLHIQEKYESVDIAVQSYLKSREGKMDGIEIDWDK